jgi:Fe-Mn family superoxide dismutase
MKALDHVYQAQPLKPGARIDGVSKRAMVTHHDDLYEGYIKKANEIHARLDVLQKEVVEGKSTGNSTYSELRALKEGETYAVNGIYLHEWYFEGLRAVSGTGNIRGEAPDLAAALETQFDSADAFIALFTECAISARGWTILAWDTRASRLAIYNCDAHNQGGVWGAIPIIVLDVYEHAYFMDFGAQRSDYIESFWKSFDWKTANDIYSRVMRIKV